MFSSFDNLTQLNTTAYGLHTLNSNTQKHSATTAGHFVKVQSAGSIVSKAVYIILVHMLSCICDVSHHVQQAVVYFY